MHEEKLRIGDRVIGRNIVDGVDLRGMYGTLICIVDYPNSGRGYCVEWDNKDPRFHSGDGRGRECHCWWCWSNDVEPAEESFYDIQDVAELFA